MTAANRPSTPPYEPSADLAGRVAPCDAPQILRCVPCWRAIGPGPVVETVAPAVVVAQGESMCEHHARTTWDAVWG